MVKKQLIAKPQVELPIATEPIRLLLHKAIVIVT